MIEEIKRDIEPLIFSLENHSVYQRISNQKQLALFMERHCYAVLDFMSLLYSLKRNLLPDDMFWTPRKNSKIARFINEIILGEESDEDQNGHYISHFELYRKSMIEIGCNVDLLDEFVKTCKISGVEKSLSEVTIPNSAKEFTKLTYNLIEENNVFDVASSFCFGREKIIPKMFQAFLDKTNYSTSLVPNFDYYLKRHIEIDGDHHGPMCENLLIELCGQDKNLWDRVKDVAFTSIKARITFWDTVELEIFES